jgi:hypothetical protein
VALGVGLLGVAALCIGMAPNARAATAYSLYSYDMSTVNGSTVANAAAANTAVPLQLSGTWSPAAFGVFFAGDQSSAQSVATAKPSSGYTLNVPEAKAIGVAIRFRYTAPTTGTCFSDSPNLTQIGRYAKYVAQIKVQLSNCGINKTSVYPQCRVAGSKSPATVWPRTSTLALVDGTTYVLYCFEGVTTSGVRTMFLRTTPVGSTMTANQWTYNSPGSITSSAYLSVANKYPLPSQTNNTDQFVGDVVKVAYCSAATPGLVSTCLSTEVPTT